MDLRKMRGMREDTREAEGLDRGTEDRVLSAGCLWSVDRGRRARAYGAHLPVRADRDLAGGPWRETLRAKHVPGIRGPINRPFTQQPRALQTQ